MVPRDLDALDYKAAAFPGQAVPRWRMSCKRCRSGSDRRNEPRAPWRHIGAKRIRVFCEARRRTRVVERSLGRMPAGDLRNAGISRRTHPVGLRCVVKPVFDRTEALGYQHEGCADGGEFPEYPVAQRHALHRILRANRRSRILSPDTGRTAQPAVGPLGHLWARKSGSGRQPPSR